MAVARYSSGGVTQSQGEGAIFWGRGVLPIDNALYGPYSGINFATKDRFKTYYAIVSVTMATVYVANERNLYEWMYESEVHLAIMGQVKEVYRVKGAFAHRGRSLRSTIALFKLVYDAIYL